jgi:putative transposase
MRRRERFVQTSLREWAYARAYNTSDDRAAELPSGSAVITGIGLMAVLNQKPPISRLTQTEDNLLRLHI